MGRPTKYKAQYCDELIAHMAEGLSFESFAGVCGVAKSSLYEWEAQNHDFSEAKKIAFEKNRLFWEKQGIEGLWSVESSEGQGKEQTRLKKTLNATVWIFNMKNRFPTEWREKTENVNLNANLDYNDLSDDELEKRIKELEAKREKS